MKNILIYLRIPRVRLKHFFAVSTVFLSFTLTACGGGSGPNEEGDGSLLNSNASTNTSDSSSNKSLFVNGINHTASSLDTVTSLCDKQNILVCEDFEWSSSLSYIATESDWGLNGWKYIGSSSNGNVCKGKGINDSQCALMWTQQQTVANAAAKQSAAFQFSIYGAGEQHIIVDWSMQWSESWVWDSKATPLLSIDAINENQIAVPLITVEVNPDGVVQLLLGNTQCAGTTKLVQAAQETALMGDGLLNWQKFELEYQMNSVTIRLNNNVIVSTNVSGTLCNNNQGVNGITLALNAINSKVTQPQSVLIDNVSVEYQ